MARYYTRTLLLPDNTRLSDFIVEINGQGVLYYPFSGEIHSTIYADTPLLCSFRNDLEGKTVELGRLDWAFGNSSSKHPDLYVYRLTPCSSCTEGRFLAIKL